MNEITQCALTVWPWAKRSSLTKNAVLMTVGCDRLSLQNKTSGRNDEKMYCVTNRRYFRRHDCPCKCSRERGPSSPCCHLKGDRQVSRWLVRSGLLRSTGGCQSELSPVCFKLFQSACDCQSGCSRVWSKVFQSADACQSERSRAWFELSYSAGFCQSERSRVSSELHSCQAEDEDEDEVVQVQDERHSGGCHFSQDWFVQAPLRCSVYGRRDILPDGLRPSGLLLSLEFFHPAWSKELDVTLVLYAYLHRAGTAIVSFRILPVSFPLPTVSWSSLNATLSPVILNHCSFFNPLISASPDSILPFPASKFRDLEICSILLFTIVFNLWRSGFAFWWISRLYFQRSFELIRLSYSKFVQTFQDTIRRELFHR